MHFAAHIIGHMYDNERMYTCIHAYHMDGEGIYCGFGFLPACHGLTHVLDVCMYETAMDLCITGLAGSLGELKWIGKIVQSGGDIMSQSDY